MTDAEFAQYLDAKFLELSPELLVKAKGIFSTLLPMWRGSFWASYKKHGAQWFMEDYGHLRLGMAIRNLLRENGVMDTDVPDNNLDDYYIQMLEYWMGVRK